MSIRFKRLIAFLIDWNITLFPFVFIFVFLSTFLKEESSINPLIGLFCFFTVIIAFVAFMLRDVIFKGRSLGKRLFGLYVYEKSSLKQASPRQCFLRNIFFFLYFIDGIVLLVTGQTIGDRVAGTLVTSEQGFEFYTNEIQSDTPVPKQKEIKKAVLVITIIIACLTIFLGLILTVLNNQKDTAEYKVAYSYFVESQAFKELNIDESKIHFNQYSSQTYTSKDNNSVSQTVRIGFIVNFKSFEVVCHKENDIWQVCTECTLFE
ncbi:MAG: RDD family protein [Clostridia bacterium]|nr:RDD family protein [Clostridia bacterium]